ncbi:hypothetical protein [Hydrocoleum sp. CS-953]|uniref:hypothetical protein n=1 Tax=Hydrocoleum sp. CS-953 TaxID=1671698 RepID=UPI00143D6183|nr:hypothetical protein [Hydrocoleum sp. CS-953]
MKIKIEQSQILLFNSLAITKKYKSYPNLPTPIFVYFISSDRHLIFTRLTRNIVDYSPG